VPPSMHQPLIQTFPRALQAMPRVDDVGAITERPLPGLLEASYLDDIAGRTHPVSGERLGQPIASDLLRCLPAAGLPPVPRQDENVALIVECP
jgi:hypothetical protein